MNTSLRTINWKTLLISLAISLGTGIIGTIFSPTNRSEYSTLYQPPLAPPGWLFPIVWTILFILMGIAAWLVYESGAPQGEVRAALIIYGIQLVVNVLWSVIFFRFDAYLLAFVWILLLWYLIYITLKRFYDIVPAAGYLLLPYLLWVTFAGYLTLAITIYYS